MSNEIIRANGTRQEYLPADGKHYTLEELRKAVGGEYIEIVPTNDGRIMVIDEEGKLKGLPVNTEATRLYRFGDQDPIMGDALVCEDHNIK